MGRVWTRTRKKGSDLGFLQDLDSNSLLDLEANIKGLSGMTAFLILIPSTKQHHGVATMHAVHFWGQGRSYLSDQRVPYL